MMEMELGSGWIVHEHCKVDNVLLRVKKACLLYRLYVICNFG